jgi:hypothetical protein
MHFHLTSNCLLILFDILLAEHFLDTISILKYGRSELIHMFFVSTSYSTKFTSIRHTYSIKQRFLEVDDQISKEDLTHRTYLNAKCLFGLHQNASQTIKPIAAAKPANTAIPDTIRHEKSSTPNEEQRSMIGSKRRIPRPTQMLRPKLIGKSVEGSAMQAVTASRLRASSRPLPPQRSVSGSGKSPVAVHSHKDKEKSKKRAHSTNEIGKASSSRLLPCASQTKLIRDISALLKTPAPIPHRAKLNQLSIQSMLQNFLQYTRKDCEEEQLQLNHLFTTCYGNYLGCISVEHLKCDNEASALSFLGQLIKNFNTKQIYIPEKLSSSPFFVSKKLMSSAVHQSFILLQLSTRWDTSGRVYVFSCQAWLIISTNISENNKKAIQGYARPNMVETDVAMIEGLANDFVVSLGSE